MRVLRTILQILKINNQNTIFIANGLFLEILIAGIFRKINFVAKIPGDIVWERSRNLGRTSTNFLDFQDENLKMRDSLNRFLFTLCLRKAKKIIAPTQQLANIIANWGISKNRIVVIPNGVDSFIYKPAKIKKEIDVICVSRLVSWKHIDEIIKDIQSIQDQIYTKEQARDKVLADIQTKQDAKIEALESKVDQLTDALRKSDSASSALASKIAVLQQLGKIQ